MFNIGIIGSFASAAPNGLLNGLVSYWKADTNGSFPDAHGSNNGTINGATFTTSGKINGAYSFDGINDDIVIADNASLDITGGLTLNVWVNLDTAKAFSSVFKKGNGNTQNYTIDFGSTGLQPRFVFFNGSFKVFQNGAITTGGWNMITVTHTFGNGASTKIYRNGVSSTGSWVAGSGNESAVTNANALNIGQTFGNGIFLDGRVDEPAIWNSVLTAQQVTDLYNGGAGLSYNNFTI